MRFTAGERAEWMAALGVASDSYAAAEVYRWSRTASVVEEEFRAVSKAVAGVKTSYAGIDLSIAAGCMSAVVSDLDFVRRAFTALAQDGAQP